MNNRVALVTGGTRGIGLAIAKAFAANGVEVVITYLRNHAAAEAAASELSLKGPRVTPLQADSAQRKDNERVFEVIRRDYGQLDVLVANAGFGVFGPTLALTDQNWRWTMDSNARGLLQQTQLAMPLMANRPVQGRIVTIISSGAERALVNYGAIGVAKAATNALVRYLALELGPQNITVNAVSPGLIDGVGVDRLPQRQLLMRVVRTRTPMGRMTTVEDVAKAVMFLCSDDASMIHGHTIVVDGGLSIRW